MITKLSSSYCETQLAECYCKESDFQYKLAEISLSQYLVKKVKNLNISGTKRGIENSKRHFASHIEYLLIF